MYIWYKQCLTKIQSAIMKVANGSVYLHFKIASQMKYNVSFYRLSHQPVEKYKHNNIKITTHLNGEYKGV